MSTTPATSAPPKSQHAVIAGSALAVTGLLLVWATPTQAAFPGDNGLVAYASDGLPNVGPPINDDIYVLQTTTDDSGYSSYVSVRLTTDPAVDRQPAVSPNGKEIAFVRGSGSAREIYVMDAKDDDGNGEGDNLRRLTDNTAADIGPAWSPGGERIVFQSTRDGNGEIYVMDAADGSEPVNLTRNPAADSQPVVSPGGDQIAFTTTRTGDSEVFVMNTNGTDPTNVTNRPSFIDGFPDFSPDGQRLALAANPVGVAVSANAADMFVINVDGSGLRNLTADLVNPAGQRMNERWPAWSPEGTEIAVWAGLGFGTGTDAEIYAVNVEGAGTSANLTSNQAGDVEPDWGPAPTHPRN